MSQKKSPRHLPIPPPHIQVASEWCPDDFFFLLERIDLESLGVGGDPVTYATGYIQGKVGAGPDPDLDPDHQAGHRLGMLVRRGETPPPVWDWDRGWGAEAN